MFGCFVDTFGLESFAGIAFADVLNNMTLYQNPEKL
jgi:hypothetical protein